MSHRNSYAVGFDIGGSSTKIGLVDSSGRIIESRQIPSDLLHNPQPFLNKLFLNIEELIHSCTQDEVLGIGMSLHGFLNDKGPIVSPYTPSLGGLDLLGMVRDYFKLPVVMNSDLVAHTLAEYYFGTGRGTNRFLCMAIGTGLGAGVVIDGKALKYTGGCPGDTGHIIVEPGGPECSMGCKGCAEALCGVAGIERLVKERTGVDVPANVVIAGARDGNLEFVPIIEQIGDWLGIALASLSVIYLPQRIALSGGVAEAGPILLNATKYRFYDLVGTYHTRIIEMTSAFHQGVEIVLGKNRGQSGVIGSVVELIIADKL
jgi:glucokinase